MSVFKCLFPLVGLRKKPCNIECYEDERIPSVFDSKDLFYSSTNYYVSNLLDLEEELFSIKKSNQGIFKMFLDSKVNATQSVEFDIRNAIISEYDNRFSSWNGSLGESKKNQLASTKEYSALIISPDSIKGGGLFINSLNFCTKEPKENIELRIFRSDDMSTTLHVIKDLKSDLNKLSQKIYLPFDFEENCDETPSYVLVWKSEGCEVYKNKIDCGCGGSNKTKYKKYLTVQGSTFDESDEPKCKNITYGLSIDATFSCDPLDWVCKCSNIADFEMINVLSKILQLKTTIELINKILSSNNLNYFTLVSRESLFGKKKAFVNKYENLIMWLVENINVSKYTDCLKCKTKKRRILKGQILV